ncbi:hypothetical protein HEP84_42835 [Streptomyces sp. RLB1-33]|nr:hypothetical protein [Streptomyces sp. RLB1-33]QIY74819.1 hypothetical protein HEP84_42835 [Streptomyces sp. RLB1-33]
MSSSQVPRHAMTSPGLPPLRDRVGPRLVGGGEDGDVDMAVGGPVITLA